MRLPIGVAVATSVAGAVVWAVAEVAEFGSVTGESIDPSQHARIVAPVPAGIGIAKPLGLTMIVVGMLVVGVLWVARR
jgi:hypothetical protein